MPKPGEPITVALSGGVDSSVAASILLDQGLGPISGVFMRNYDSADDPGKRGCEWEKDWEAVRGVGRQLGIPVEVANFCRDYWVDVWEPSLRVWEAGGTPNADVLCNRMVKFGAFSKYVRSRSPNSWIATGHYAVLRGNTTTPTTLHRCPHHRKDQSYYLATTPTSALSRAIFPLGLLAKSDVRQIARDKGLDNAEREESMGVCFVEPKGRFSHFLDEHLPPNPGPVVDLNGTRLGTHNGLWCYTIGERCRLPGQRSRMFVASKSASSNEIVVVPGSDHPSLLFSHLETKDFVWLDGVPCTDEELRSGQLSVRVRTGDIEATACKVTRNGRGHLEIELAAPAHGCAMGQYIVLHRGEQVLGAGTISHANQGDTKPTDSEQ